VRKTLKRNEVLRGRKNFDLLFNRGERRSGSTIRCLVLREGEDAPVRVTAGFAVPKTVRRAVDRNRIKRFMRESYRLHKQLLAPESLRVGLVILFLYARGKSSPEGLPSYRDVEHDMIELLRYLAQVRS
jgi:ribonuclease P protein component